MKDKNNFVGVALFLLALLLTVGTVCLFPTCGPMESGSWMKCHWSGQAVIGAGLVILLQSVAYVLLKDRPIRVGISLSVVPVAFLALAVPNGLIGLCGNAGMQCRATTQPAVTILSAAIAVLAAANVIRLLRTGHKKELAAL